MHGAQVETSACCSTRKASENGGIIRSEQRASGFKRFIHDFLQSLDQHSPAALFLRSLEGAEHRAQVLVGRSTRKSSKAAPNIQGFRVQYLRYTHDLMTLNITSDHGLQLSVGSGNQKTA